ncbi:MAG: ribonuclease P protein subunit [Candidatus ainarchaeum sp.]|nr:ribonuclease P protein subunit [Candidatus ainarchaeum sp.]
MGKKEIMEYLGLEIEIMESSDDSQKGIKGKVYNETKNVFVVECKDGLKTIPKKGKMFKFRNGKEEYLVNGDKINYRPEERIKLCWRT